MFKKCLLMVVCALSLVGCGNKYSNLCEENGLNSYTCNKIVDEYKDLGEQVVEAMIRGEGEIQRRNQELYQQATESYEQGLQYHQQQFHSQR
jgi:hypothetical protein